MIESFFELFSIDPVPYLDGTLTMSIFMLDFIKTIIGIFFCSLFFTVIFGCARVLNNRGMF
ncbi:MAG: hypothetical protein E7507_01365 [Ruminococcus sp.]|nr:hypothetical protein [Ruminococcus sp.]